MTKSMSVGEFKTNFSEVIKLVEKGVEVIVTYGKNKNTIGRFIPESKPKKKIGILDGKAKAIFKDGFKMTEEEFIGA